MKKLLTSVLTVAVLVALASTASAVTCTIDQKPAATLLVPYFQISLNADGSVPGGGAANYRDTLVTIGNASNVNTLAHVTIYNRRSFPVLDFMLALTPFDIESMSMLQLLGNGALASLSTPDNGPDQGLDVCQRSMGLGASDFVRFTKSSPASGFDNSSATTQYSNIPSSYLPVIWDELDGVADCGTAVGSGSIPQEGSVGLLEGYIVIDMANYCTVANPDNTGYWNADAAGWENNLWGDYILVSGGSGLPTYGNPVVAVEADPNTLNGSPITSTNVERTFYGRYWESSTVGNLSDSGATTDADGSENVYLTAEFPFLIDVTYGDMREPLGGSYAARYVTCGGTDSSGNCILNVSSYMRVWRASADALTDLTGNSCTDVEPTLASAVYDEDEGLTTTGGCFSPCSQPSFNYFYETQRAHVATGDALDPTDGAFFSAAPAANGWVFLDFLNLGDPNPTNLDQAWVGYDFEASGLANVNAGIEGTSLDPNNCQAIGVNIPPVVPVVPAIPSKLVSVHRGGGPSPHPDSFSNGVFGL